MAISPLTSFIQGNITKHNNSYDDDDGDDDDDDDDDNNNNNNIIIIIILFNTQIINGFNIQIRFDTYLKTQIINPNTNILISAT